MQTGVYEDLVLRLHSNEMTICRVDRQQPEGAFDVYFGHQRIRAQLENFVDSVVYSNV